VVYVRPALAGRVVAFTLLTFAVVVTLPVVVTLGLFTDPYNGFGLRAGAIVLILVFEPYTTLGGC